jgi:hyaluronoglucosaminidase
LEEIPVLAEYRMNFLMNCYLSNFQTEGKWVNKWWEPFAEERKRDYVRIFRKCKQYDINFCFAIHPQLASPRPLDVNKLEDIDACYRHFAWAQEQGVSWFSLSLDDVDWGTRGPASGGSGHAKLVNLIFSRLREKDKEARMIFCPVVFLGDGTKKEDREYLGALAKEMDPEVYVFWTGNEVVPARMTAQAAKSYKETVRHRLIIWENYPVNDSSPTMHLGPITGREPALAGIADGYMSNPLCPQNQINRIPLLSCADFAWNPNGYDPDRSIGQAVWRWGKTDEQREILKELVELYPGGILAKPSNTGYRPVYSEVLSQFNDKLGASAEEARAFVAYVENLEKRMKKAFPSAFEDARKTMRQNIGAMKEVLEKTR